MPVTAIDSQGTVLTLDGVTIGGVKGISGLGSGSPSERDRSTLEDRKFKRFGVGLRDGGSATVNLILDSTDPGQRKANRYWRDATRGTFVLILTNGTTMRFGGFVTAFPKDVNADSDITGTLTIRVDGEISGFPDPS